MTFNFFVIMSFLFKSLSTFRTLLASVSPHYRILKLCKLKTLIGVCCTANLMNFVLIFEKSRLICRAFEVVDGSEASGHQYMCRNFQNYKNKYCKVYVCLETKRNLRRKT